MADESQVSSNAYGFLFLGLLLIICNLPVLIVVVRVRKLRSQYGVLILSLVNGLITGTVSTGYGIFRLVLFQMEKDDEVVPIGACFYNPLTFFLLWTFPMNGLGLLINSIDRLIVITFPMSYFNYNTRVVVILNVLAIIINAVLVFVAIYVTLANSPDGKMVNIFCSQNDLFSKGMYIFLAGLRIIFAVLAVSVMFIVLIIFIKHNNVRSKQAFHTEESMKKFRSKQMNYTKTMLISCIATTLFMIIPSVVAIIGRSGTLDVTGHVTTWTRFINFFNSFNIAVLLIYRQEDIRWRLYKLINKVAHRHIFNVTAIVSTSGEMTQVPVQAISKISSRRTS